MLVLLCITQATDHFTKDKKEGNHEKQKTTTIPKLAIVDRLITLGKLADALTALNSDVTKKARWDASTQIALDDADVIAVLTALGIDASQVLY